MTKHSITLHSLVSQAAEVVGSKIEDRIALMSIKNGSYYGMDPVGSRVWELIAQPMRVDAVCERLLGEFNVEKAACERQVLAFLQQLSDADLLSVADESAP